MPRMTNTFMRAGKDDPAELLLARVKNGIFAKAFGGGQVDIVSGKFVFSCTEAYRIENGKLGAPIKGATLIGDGPSSPHSSVLKASATISRSTKASACAERADKACRPGLGNRRCWSDGLTLGGTAV